MSVFSTSLLSASDISFARRVKPLPKRRRTSFRRPEVVARVSTTSPPLTSSAYYHPISGGRIDRLKQESNIAPSHSRTPKKSTSTSARSRIVDDAEGEGDYTDHLQQPNNTKKRKVPAATVALAREHSSMRDNDDLIDEESSQDSQTNILGKLADDIAASQGLEELDHQAVIVNRKPASLVTVATLRLKELLKARQKMMAAVIRDDIDPLALEFALSAPFARPPTQPPVRAWSYGPKLRRRPRNRTSTPLNRESCFSSNFTFSFPGPTGNRYTIAKKVASGLQLRFQTELARQATAAAEITLKTTLKPPNSSSVEIKKVDSGPTHAPPNEPSIDKSSKKPNKSKKKKRVALANASNPHHLRNYVPSRVLHSGHPAASSQGQSQTSSLLGPLALKFLSATLPPRRKGRTSAGENSGSSLIHPETEWICPFCEHSLFYGGDAAMQRAVRNRRKVLARRRNARERAAAAASGAIASRSRDTSDDEGEGESEDEDEDEDEDDSFGEGSDIAPDVPLPREATTIGVRQDNRGPHPGG